MSNYREDGLPPKAPKGRRVAEREGFEPPIRLPVCRISSAVRSTTLPPLRKRPASSPTLPREREGLGRGKIGMGRAAI